ncbi:MAG: aspartate/glutamate racemase family protein [Thermodesulfobacteriota bacterium]|nr:aspartate/glutamate racemase family protein [Thermodesulfobacteriota bacterium]
MKICYINITEEQITGPYLDIIRKTADKILRPDTQMEIKCVKPGLTRAFDLHTYFGQLNNTSIIERAIEAEEEGFDAVVVGCYADPGVKEARATVDIPVIGISEASMSYACLLGRRFAVVTLNEPDIITEMEDAIRYHGMEARAISNPVRLIKMSSYDVFTKGMADPRIVAEDILERAKESAADGADAVIIGCNGLGPLSTLSDLVRVEEGSIPILDCISVGLKTAEMIHEMTNCLGIPYTSRHGTNALPKKKNLNRVRKNFGLREV